MKKKHVLNCQFSSWYLAFKNCSIQSKIIPLQAEFIDYLNQDGVVLPGNENEEDMQYESDSESEDWSTAEDCNTATATAPDFTELTKNIEDAIEELGGEVFPKLNWSAPRDASWISYNGTLKCTTASDVYLLLKSSDRVSHDINHPFRKCEDGEDNTLLESSGFFLVLRKWQEISSSTEFRCFVKKHHIIAISQRDTASHYPYIAQNYDEIHSRIKEFFHKKISGKFPDDTYVFDIFLKSSQVVKLMDFNPFGDVTDPLLYTWDELSRIEPDEQAGPVETMYRFVTSNTGVQPSPFLSSRVPRERLNLTSSDDINKMVDFLKTTELISESQANNE
jgi:hypothetical protein